jgi:hypothetical protein
LNGELARRSKTCRSRRTARARARR